MNLVGALLLIHAWFGPAEMPCREAAVSGDQAAVTLVKDELAHRGIGLAHDEKEAALRVRVDRTATGLRIELRDREGRSANRSVASPATAAALIESWLRSDIAEPLMTGRPLLESSPRDDSADAPAPWLTAAAESALATDRSFWAGVSVGACLRLGPLCGGLLLRVAGAASQASDVVYDGAQVRDFKRFAAEALLGAEVPTVERGRWALILGLGAGAAWVVSHTAYGEHDGSVARLGFMAEGRAKLSASLSRAVAIELGLSAAVYPLAHQSSFRDDGFTIPGTPLGQLRTGLGVRYGYR